MTVLEYLRELHDASAQLASRFTLDGLDSRKRAALLLYGNVVELAEAYLLLAEQRSWTGTHAVVRSLMEAFVDFQNVVGGEARYLASLERESLRSLRLRIVEARSDPDNDFLAGVRELPNAEDIARRLAARIDELEELGGVRLSIEERFRLADANSIYQAIYRALSDEAHNNLGKLYSKALVGETIGFAIHRRRSPEEMLHLTDSVAGLLAAAGQEVHRLLESPAIDELDGRRATLEALRDGYRTG